MDFKDEKLEAKMLALGLKWTDFEEKLTKGGGKGGQKINKSVNCVQLRHLPTGQEVRVQKFRELWGNRLSAYRLLVSKIEEQKLGKKSSRGAKKEKLKKQKKRRQRKTREKITGITALS
jgi:protein subunit release factor B